MSKKLKRRAPQVSAFVRGFEEANAEVHFERTGAVPRLRRRSAIWKLAFAANHLFWSLFDSNRINRALEDIGQAAGRIAAVAGYRQRTKVTTQPVAAPSVHSTRSPILVQCFGTWDFNTAARYLTPEGDGTWDGVRFTAQRCGPADWVAFLSGTGGRDVQLHASPERVLFAVGEPPTAAHRPLHLGQEEGTIVLTCDDELVASAPPVRRYVLEPCMTPTWSVWRGINELRRAPTPEKTRNLSWVTSDIVLMPGHRERLDFLRSMRGKIDFDLYGRGFNPIADKWSGLSSYRYSIAYENSMARYYFTEKVMDCFVAGTMPIYCGSPSITEFFPPDSLVVFDPDDPDVFEKINDVVKSPLAETRKDAIEEAKHLVLEKYNVFARLANFIKQNNDSRSPSREMVITPVAIDFSKA